jgi:hypothetical protein
MDRVKITGISDEVGGHDGKDDVKYSRRNGRVTKPTSSHFHAVSRSQESMSKCTVLRVASL